MLSTHKSKVSSNTFESAFNQLLNQEMDFDQSLNFLQACSLETIDSEHLTLAAKILLKRCKKINLQSPQILDCVGTGGDGLNTYNISTLVSIVLSSLHHPIAKHGNVKATSNVGSANVIESLDIPLSPSTQQLETVFHQHHFCFLFAQNFHPTLKALAKARQAYQKKTLFNLLGPLINPARPTHMLVGVASPTYIKPMATALSNCGVSRALVVHGSGLDEIALHGPSFGLMVEGSRFHPFEVTPEDFGLPHYPLNCIQPKTPSQSIQDALMCLQGTGPQALQAMVSANAGALLSLISPSKSLKEHTLEVLKHLLTGKAYQHLQNIQGAFHAAQTHN